MKQKLLSKEQYAQILEMIEVIDLNAEHMMSKNESLKINRDKAVYKAVYQLVNEQLKQYKLEDEKIRMKHLVNSILNALPIVSVRNYKDIIHKDEIINLARNQIIEFNKTHQMLDKKTYMYYPPFHAFLPIESQEIKGLIVNLLDDFNIKFLTKSSSGYELFERIAFSAQPNVNERDLPIEFPVVEQAINAGVENKKFVYELPVPGGVFDCSALQFKPHSESTLQFIDENCLSFVPQTNQKYDDLFDKYYLSIADGDTIRAQRLKQAHLAAFLGLKMKTALILVGEAGTGKSTYLNILETLALLTSNQQIAHTSLSDFDKDDALVQVSKSSAVINRDNADKFILNSKAVENFKKLIQGEPITAFQKFKDRLDFIFNGIMVQATNDIPRFEYASSAQPILDRISLIIFKRRFRNQSNDIIDYDKILTDNEHLPYLIGYLLKNLDAFHKWVNHSDDLELQKAIQSDDTVEEFVKFLIENNLKINKKIPITFLKAMYYHWMKQHMPTSKALGDRTLKPRLIEAMRKRGYQFGEKPLYTMIPTIIKSNEFMPDSFKGISHNKAFLEDLEYFKNSTNRTLCFVLTDATNNQNESCDENDQIANATKQLTVIEHIVTNNKNYLKELAEMTALKDCLFEENNQQALEDIKDLYHRLIKRE